MGNSLLCVLLCAEEAFRGLALSLGLSFRFLSRWSHHCTL